MEHAGHLDLAAGVYRQIIPYTQVSADPDVCRNIQRNADRVIADDLRQALVLETACNKIY